MPGVDELQSLCDEAQQQLQRLEYLACERTLERAERMALEREDYDSLARLYMPLQEARRQRRLRCGDGVVRLDLLAEGPGHALDAAQIVDRYPHGQLLVAGWCSIEPGARLRRLQRERDLYVEAYLAAVYPVGAARAVVIVPTADVGLPSASNESIDELMRCLPAHSIVMGEGALLRGERRGTTETFAHTMSIWERLHAPFLGAADMQVDPLQKIHAYRRTIEVDYACELAHQKLSDTARQVARHRRAGRAR
jgi:hypothetical protein